MHTVTLPLAVERTKADSRTAIDLLRVHGYAILPQRLPRALVEDLRASVRPLIDARVADSAGFRHNRLLLTIEHLLPVLRDDVLAHPAVVPIIRALLGEDAHLSALGLDVNLPGSAHQPSHMDCPYLFPETSIALPPFAVVLNIPLVDVNEENGPLELWPGTHGNQHDIDQDSLIARMPSQRPCLAAGSLLLRDIRLWHRGTPNRSRSARPQIGIAYARPWYRGPHLTLPAAVHDAWPEDMRPLVARGE